MESSMRIGKFNLDTDDLPVMTLDEARDQVREGRELVIWWSIKANTDTTRDNILSALREFTEREFIVVDETEVPIGRLQEPTPHPFPDLYATLREECAKNMREIRNRSSALLKNAKAGGEDVLFFVSAGLVDIERAIQHVRNNLEVTLYRQYIDDVPMDDEQKDTYLHYARSGFESPEYALHVLEQSLSLLVKHQASPKSH